MPGRTLPHRNNPPQHPAKVDELRKGSPFPRRGNDEKREKDQNTYAKARRVSVLFLWLVIFGGGGFKEKLASIREVRRGDSIVPVSR